MDSNAKQDLLAKSRRNKSDLIDLSHDLDDHLCNNILDLFDPLNHNVDATTKQYQHQNNLTSNRTSKPSELRKRDRRFRTTSASTTSINKNVDTTSKSSGESYRVKKISVSDVSKASQSSTESSATGTCLSEKDDIDRKLNKLFVSSSEGYCGNSSSCSDLSGGSPTGPIKATKGAILSESKLKLGRKFQRSNQEIVILTDKIKSFRAQYRHHDISTNSGLVYSPTLYSSKVRDMSVKIIITSPLASSPLNFTCNVSTTIEHLISHAVCSMFDSLKDDDSMENYMLKVTGKDEFFDSKLSLADYALVTHCWKFDLDVQMTLILSSNAKRPFLRTPKDDFRCKSLLCPDDLLSRTAILKYSDLNYEALNITIETFDSEAERLYHDVTNKSTCLQTQGLLQTTKAICSLMMNCEISQLTDSKNNLVELCISYKNEGEQLLDEDRYKMIEVIQHAIKRLLQNMHRLLTLTSTSLPVDYEVLNLMAPNKEKTSFVDTPINLLKDQVKLRVQLVAQLKPDWLMKYQEFYLEVNLMHGETLLCPSVKTSTTRVDKSFFYRLLFDDEVTMLTTYSCLPREARFVLILFGTEILPKPSFTASNQLTVPNPSDEPGPLYRAGSSTSICSTAPMYSSSPKNSQIIINEPVQSALASAVSNVFDAELNLHQGDRLLFMYPLSENVQESVYHETFADRSDPVLVIELSKFPTEKRIYFPKIVPSKLLTSNEKYKVSGFEHDSLDSGRQYVLNSIIYEKQTFEPLMDDEKELLWDNRLYLTSIPEALPKVLLSTPDWSSTSLSHLYSLIDCWKPMEAIDAIQLLLPTFPDTYVRGAAIKWISRQHDDELCDYLPQLVQAFRYEKNIDCPLLWLLIERALKNVRIANLLYWQLKLNAQDRLFKERSETLTNCLLHTCGQAFWKSIDKQEDLLNQLTNVSNEIKKVRDSQRMSVLHKKLEQVQDYLLEKKPTMPWAPSLEVCDLELKSCSYFPSNTLPLKLAFRSCEESCNKSVKFHNYDTIFKMGDDLRQDMLAIQMIRIMEKLWLREGLDLRMVTFDCIATNDRQGMVEMVQNAETLRKIQQSSSLLAGAFNPRAIDSYIRLWNTSELEYKTALDKFLHSCAGYSVATYILGICDRHNDNIMVTNSGHLFHIDFGKFLGDAQMMGSIKRDRAPFVLSADMAYVINGGDRPSKKFQTFIELCTMGFNIIRRHRNLFLNLFSLMSSAKIHGLNSDSVKYIDKMLMPNLTETEAMAKFTRLIDECLKSRSTQVNFFIHNLAQLRFSNDTSKQSLLSFVPKTFTIHTDGKIESLILMNLFKLYEPEKQYYYVVRVKRLGQPDPTDITRTFHEFSELEMKLNSQFPGIHFHDINKSTGSFLMDLVGRTNTREVAERRMMELKTFLANLLRLPPEISECDLIYTFFHPILRDQTANSNDMSRSSETSSTFGYQEYSEAQRNALYVGSNGQVKLSLSYKNSTLSIMVMHAKNLVCPENSAGPNCYAKTYLLPDPTKQTKQKTRVVRQSCHPSFMELISYKIPVDALKRLTLQVSIWHSELTQSKYSMGAALIPLDRVDFSKETTSWYPLKNF